MGNITRLENYKTHKRHSELRTNDLPCEHPILLKGQFGRKSAMMPPAPYEVIQKNLFFILSSRNFGKTGYDSLDQAHHELWFETGEFLSHHMEHLTERVSPQDSRQFAHLLAEWTRVAPLHKKNAHQTITEVENKFFTHFADQGYERAPNAYLVRLQSAKLKLQAREEPKLLSDQRPQPKEKPYSPWTEKREDKGRWDTTSAPAYE